MKTLSLTAVLIILAACSNMKGPSVSGDPKSMSGDTLCFRAANKDSAAMNAEIEARNLDCGEILARQPQFDDRGY